MGKAIHKGEFTKLVAERMGVSQNQGAKAVEAVIDSILAAVTEYDSIVLTGFGKFEVRQIKERKMRDISGDPTSEMKTVPAHKRLGFSPGSDAKKVMATLD